MKKLPKIIIETIPNNKQRYPTCGDYFKKNNKMFFKISKLKNPDYEFLIAIHELIEWFLYQRKGLKIQDIDRFDIMFEKERKQGKWKNEESGFDKRAPYRKEHIFATKIERFLAKKLGVKWHIYDKSVNKLI